MNSFFGGVALALCFLFALFTRFAYFTDTYHFYRRISAFLSGISAVLFAVYLTGFKLTSMGPPYKFWQIVEVAGLGGIVITIVTGFWYSLSYLLRRTRNEARDEYDDPHAFRLLNDREK